MDSSQKVGSLTVSRARSHTLPSATTWGQQFGAGNLNQTCYITSHLSLGEGHDGEQMAIMCGVACDGGGCRCKVGCYGLGSGSQRTSAAQRNSVGMCGQGRVDHDNVCVGDNRCTRAIRKRTGGESRATADAAPAAVPSVHKEQGLIRKHSSP